MNKREANQVLKRPKFGDAMCIAAANHLRVLRRLAVVRGLAEYHEIIYCGEHDLLGSKGFRLDCKCDSRTLTPRRLAILESDDAAKELSSLEWGLECWGVDLTKEHHDN